MQLFDLAPLSLLSTVGASPKQMTEDYGDICLIFKDFNPSKHVQLNQLELN